MTNRLEASGDLNALNAPRTHTGQILRDASEINVNVSGVRQAAGSVILAPLHVLGKGGNGLVKDFGNLFLAPEDKSTPEPLRDGSAMHLRRDIPAIARNTVDAVFSLATLRPLRALGKGINAAADAFDIAIVDPALDIGNLVAGHEKRQTRGKVFSQAA